MRWWKSGILMMCAAWAVAAPARAAAPESFAPIVDPLLPAVVNISTTQKIQQPVGPAFGIDPEGLPPGPGGEQLRQFFEQFNRQFGGGGVATREVTSLGSGFVIDPSGYVVTNNHVIGNAESIRVIFHDNSHLNATVVGRDPKTDLALLKVKPEKPLAALKFGDSDALRVGDWVIAIGNPFGLGGSVSAGIVSARGRNINAGPFDDFIQTDAAINRGNSGGPLLNTRGEVVGINSAIFSPTGGNIGIGFAVPSAIAKSVIAQLQKSGKISRGWLGVKIEVVSEELANATGLGKPRGALVRDISPQSPAKAAGLEVGDIILSFNGQAIDEMRKLPRAVADAKPGSKVALTYWRKGKEQSTALSLAEMPANLGDADAEDRDDNADQPPPVAGKEVLGLRVVPLTKPLRAQLGLKSGIAGVLVQAIDPAGEGASRGIRPGDVITEVQESPVGSAKEISEALAGAKKAGRDFAVLRVLRRGETFFATVAVK